MNVGNLVPETSSAKPLSYQVKIVREENVPIPVKAVVKIGSVETQRATLKNVSTKNDVLETTSGPKSTVCQPTYRDYIVNKKSGANVIKLFTTVSYTFW